MPSGLIRQCNFESLANEILFSKEDLPQSVKENMRHEKAYNEIARERYYNVMCFYLNRDVQLREAAIIHKIFETNFSFHVKLRNTGKF